MKKKVLLIVALCVMLICVLAIAISAEGIHNSQTVNFNETVTLRDGTVCNLFDENGNALIWFRNLGVLQSVRADDTDSSDGNWVEYILPKSNYAALANINIHIGDSLVGTSDIVVFNIMDDDIDADMDINTDGIQPFTVFIETFNKDNKSPWGTMKLEYAYLRHDTTAIGGKAFAKCVYLKYVNFENLTELKTIGPISTYNYGGAFVGCTSLFEGQTLDLSKTQLTAFGWGVGCSDGNFQGVPMSKLKLPLTLKTINQQDFLDCANLTTVYFGDLISTIEKNAFYGCTNLIKIYFMGTKDQYLSIQSNINKTGNDSLFAVAGDNDINVISYSDYNALSDKSGKYVIYNFSTCEYNDGVHREIEYTNACVGICQECQMLVINHVEDAKLSIDLIAYTDYTLAGTKISSCSNEGCTYNVTEETPALFTCLGYSAPENGKGGIAIGFTVNNEAIAEYEKATGKTVSYGVFAALKDSLNGSDIFAGGEANECAIVVDMTTYATAAYEIKIIGFETETQKDAQIAIGAYVKVDNDYSYMQSSAPDENEKYCFDSFNEIVDSLSN
ncbi:MAG: leucine-rich repeat protein [Clostridia bacterium]|nr:leucine-rich repeat protein [Clostridia bacterium]